MPRKRKREINDEVLLDFQLKEKIRIFSYGVQVWRHKNTYSLISNKVRECDWSKVCDFLDQRTCTWIKKCTAKKIGRKEKRPTLIQKIKIGWKENLIVNK